MIAPIQVGNRYELQDILGEGGMGIVYRALDIKTGTYVALKTMRDISDPAAVELFATEWKVLAEMSHPNIVDIRDVDVIEDHGERKPYYVMPLLKGVTLAQLIEEASPRLTIDRVVEIMLQVCRGLQAAHQNGLVHRDLKPSNIFVMDDDTAKIIDFGVVHLAGVNSGTGHKGTWQYMAPEQAEMKPATRACDIFSLGVVCYEALTLRKPFARKTPAETIEAVRKHIPPPASEINPHITPLVSMVIHKALAKQPIHRFASAREFAETLQKAYHNESIERFDRAKIQPRIERARSAFAEGDAAFASEILTEIEAEGHIDQEITLLRSQIEEAIRQKKIRQLLEGARARLEQDEIPLALDKLREVLELEPENADALRMRSEVEKQRNERQIEGWLTLAQQHLEQHDFGEARQALREVFAIQPVNKQATDLLAEIGSTEQEASRVREEKQQLYGSALKAYENGEISTALNRLERILMLARQVPEATIPERDAIYQSFYNQVRSARDTLTNGYEEGRRLLDEGKFDKTLSLCDELLGKYPNDALLQALRLEVIEAQRQELSAYIAEVGKRVESEPDLDRRVNILGEACARYPHEQQFAQSLNLVRERRDLIDSIIAKAHQYEEKLQFAEAISQWDILRNIHPQYPGIDIEIEQLTRRRAEQVVEDQKSRSVEQIENCLQTGAYAKAHELTLAALQEFPADHELTGLERIARQGLERSGEVSRLLADGQRAYGERRFAEAISVLRAARQVEPRNTAIRDALVNALIEQARVAIAKDWHDAEPFLQEAAELDGKHPTIRSLRSAVSDAKRRDYVAHCLSRARDLQAANDVTGALGCVEQGLREYPKDARLEQHRANLRNLMGASRQHEYPSEDDNLRARDDASKGRSPKPISGSQAVGQQAANAKNDKREAPIAGDATLLFGSPAPVMKAAQVLPGARLGMTPTGESSEGPGFPIVETRPSGSRDERTVLGELWQPGQNLAKKLRLAILSRVSRVRWSWQKVGGSVLALFLAVVAAIAVFHRAAEPVTPRPAVKVTVLVSTDPENATVTMDGQRLAKGPIEVESKVHKLQVSQPGFETKSFDAQPVSPWIFKLDPEATQIRIRTAEREGKVYLDDREIGEIVDGTMADYKLAVDGGTHTLTAKARRKKLFEFKFLSTLGESAQVKPFRTKELIVISSLGPRGTAYSGTILKHASLDAVGLGDIDSKGLQLPPLTDQTHELDLPQGNTKTKLAIGTENAPVIWVLWKSGIVSSDAHLLLSANVDNAKLTVDGDSVKRGEHGWKISKPPGTYKLSLKAEGYVAQTWTEKLAPGQSLTKKISLAPAGAIGSLTLHQGTPKAEVLLGERQLGQLDSQGDATFAGIPLGRHVLLLQKKGFESLTVEVSLSEAAPSKNLSGPQISLPELGSVVFKAFPESAKISYRRIDESTAHEFASAEALQLKSGQYHAVAEADGFAQLKQEFTVVPGQLTTVQLTLHPSIEMANVFASSEQLEFVNGWARSRDKSAVIFLRPNVINVNLVLQKPGVFGKKLEWFIQSESENEMIAYELKGQKLTRKMIVKGKPATDLNEVEATNLAIRDLYSVHLHMEDNHVKISTDRGNVLDDYPASGHDFSHCRLGVKTDLFFLVRGN